MAQNGLAEIGVSQIGLSQMGVSQTGVSQTEFSQASVSQTVAAKWQTCREFSKSFGSTTFTIDQTWLETWMISEMLLRPRFSLKGQTSSAKKDTCS